MVKNMEAERNEQLFDAILKVATDEALQKEMDALPSKEELDKMFPRTESFDRKMRGVIKKEFKVARRTKTIHRFTRIAAIFCLIAFAGMGALMSVSASRNFILNMIINIRGDYVAFDFGAGGTPPPSGNSIVLGYKPEGFELESSIEMDTLILYVFIDNFDNHIIVQRFIGGQLALNVDYEYMDISEIQLGNRSAYLFSPTVEGVDGAIVWMLEQDVITITTSLDSEILVRVAENLIVN